MSLDAFKRLIAYAAVFFLVVPIPAATANLLFSEDRAWVVAFAIFNLGIGVALKVASHRLCTDLRSGLRLVGYCFYLLSAGILAGFVHQFLSETPFSTKSSELPLALVQFVGTVILLLVIKKTIDGIKARNLAGKP